MMKKLSRADIACRVLKSAQMRKGLTQSDLAKRLCVTQPVVSRWLKNCYSMRVSEFDLLCKTLSVNPNDILNIQV